MRSHQRGMEESTHGEIGIRVRPEEGGDGKGEGGG